MSRLELAADQLAAALEKLEKAAPSAAKPVPLALASEQRLAILEDEKQQPWPASPRWRRSWQPFPA